MVETVAKQWYVLHTYSGYENKVKANLISRAQSMGMENNIFRVIVPERPEREIKDGKEKEEIKKTFPGYVLVEMVMTDQAWFVVRNTPGVTGFVGSHGSGSKPAPLLDSEITQILHESGLSKRHTDLDFDKGETIKIVAGPFAGLTGKITAVDTEKLKLKVVIDMFNRATNAELDFDQVDKLV